MTYSAIIENVEPIVRVIKSPQHYKNGKPKPQAFKPKVGTNIISVVRWLYKVDDSSLFKKQCQDIGNVGDNIYWGLAAIRAAHVANVGIAIEDRPEDYPGHAHFIFPIPSVPPNEPLQNDDFVRMNEILNSLIDQSKFIEDKHPGSPDWSIPDDEVTNID